MLHAYFYNVIGYAHVYIRVCVCGLRDLCVRACLCVYMYEHINFRCECAMFSRYLKNGMWVYRKSIIIIYDN